MALKIKPNGDGTSDVVTPWWLKIATGALSALIAAGGIGGVQGCRKLDRIEVRQQNEIERSQQWRKWHDDNFPPQWLVDDVKALEQKAHSHDSSP